MKPKNEEAGGVEPADLESTSKLASPSNPAVESTQEETERVIDWENDPALVLHDQAATAVFFNRAGELVIKQRDTLGSEGAIFVAPENVEKFVHGLRDRVLPALPKKWRVVDGSGNE
jgi:hypothetical protein